jgi:DNA-binding response OmpR family regulator
LILIAGAVSTEQRVLVRTLGIDHILPTPVDKRELAAVLINAVRTQAPISSRSRASEKGHRWRLDSSSWMLIAPSNREIRLSRGEYAILQALMEVAGTIVPRSTLLAVHASHCVHARTLDVLLSRLRRKIWDSTGMELPLRSARNIGYVFASQPATQFSLSDPSTAATPR